MTSLPPVLNSDTLNRYYLQIKGCNTPLDVESFTGREALSECYRYDIVLTSSNQDIHPSVMLMKDVTFIMQSLPETVWRVAKPPEVQRSVHGVITHFSRLSSSRDEATYSLTFRPRLCLLGKSRRTAIYQNQSVTDVVEQILRKNHNWPGWLFEFRLSGGYPKRELITQFQQTDLEFIECLLSEVGIGYRFEMDPEIKHEVLTFTDSGRDWRHGVTLPAVDPAGTYDGRQESLWHLKSYHQVVERSASHKDYNYRSAGEPLTTLVDLTLDDDKTTYGDDHQYAQGYLTSGEKYLGQKTPPETGEFYSRLQHERALNSQHLLSVDSNATLIAPGQVLEPQGRNVPSAFSDGMLVTAITSSASRCSHYRLHAEGMAWRDPLNWRPERKARPRITVPLPARITSLTKNDIYGHIDKTGRYRVRFDFDQAEWKAGYESPWLRLARPYAGETYGLHMPLLDGTEVSVMFDGGHPDKPFIAFAMHDSQHPDLVTAENHKRNILRSPAQNELRLQDERQKENIHLATPRATSQLNLGFNVLDDKPKEQRGEGAELRTDGHGVLRAARGVFITADGQPQAQGKLLDMEPALKELEAAYQEAASLRSAAEMAKAELADVQKQTALLNDTLKDLQQQALLLSAPSGIAQVTPASLQLAAGQNLIATTGEDADFSIAKAFRVAVGSTLSLFAKMAGIKLYAAAGKVDIQAQSDVLDMLAKQDMQITSQDGKVTISAKTELLLECGGAGIQIKDGSIREFASGNVTIKCGTLEKLGPASQTSSITLPEHCPSILLKAAGNKNASVPL